MLVVFDLDETLMHAAEAPGAPPADVHRVGPWHVRIRPGLDALLPAVFEAYDVGVWTSATAAYAAAVVPLVFGVHSPKLKFVWSSSRCTRRYFHELDEYVGIKRLSKLRKMYPLEQILMVDDSPEKHRQNYGNLVRVTPWTGNEADRELHQLRAWLLEVRAVENVRRIEKRGWQRSIAG